MWYIVQVKPNSENIFLKNIRESKLNEFIDDIIIPTSSGKKVCSGYVLIQCEELSEKLYDFIKSNEKFIRFLGHDNKPEPLKYEQVEGLLSATINDDKEEFEIGQSIVIISGSFVSVYGIIQNVNNQARKLDVKITVFGRDTTLSIDFDSVKHVQ